jgi:hypothetical protein
MDAEQLKEQYRVASEEFAEIDEAWSTGDFLKHIVPPDIFYIVRQRFLNMQETHAEKNAAKDAAFTALKQYFQQVARNHYDTHGTFYSEKFGDIDVRCRQSTVYDLDRVQEIAVQRGLVEKLRSTGIITVETTLDKEKLAQLPEEERMVFNSAMQVVLRDVTVTKKK